MVCGPQTVRSTPDNRSVSSHGAAGTFALHSEELRVFVCVFCLSVCLRVCACTPSNASRAHERACKVYAASLWAHAHESPLHCINGRQRAPTAASAQDMPRRTGRCTTGRSRARLPSRTRPLRGCTRCPTHAHSAATRPAVCATPHDGYPTPHGRRVTTRRAARRTACAQRSAEEDAVRPWPCRDHAAWHGT